MDVLFVTSAFGADIDVGFMPLMADQLSGAGNDVRGIQYEDSPPITSIPVERIETKELYTPYWFGQWLFYRDWRPKMEQTLQRLDPDVVVADRRCMVPTALAASNIGVPSVGVVPGLGFTRFNPNNHRMDKRPRLSELSNSAKIQYPFIKHLYRIHRRGLRRTSEVVTLSSYLRTVIAETFGVDSTVIRTPARLSEVEAGRREPTYLTLVNPRTELKGSEIVLSLAETLTDEQFLIAGTFASEDAETKARSLPNVDYRGWVDDMREVYAETEILLVPSLVEEGGPRVIVEAFANGIPAIGTTRGGIPEFIDGGGETVDAPMDIDGWKAAIDEVRSSYDRYAGIANDRKSEFKIESAREMFEHVLEHAVDQP